VLFLGSAASGRARGLLAQHGLEPRDILADYAQAQRVFQWFGCTPKPQAEPLLFELLDARRNLGAAQLAA